MPSVLLEIPLSVAAGVGTFKVLKRFEMSGKGSKLLSLLVGLIVFCIFPWYYDSVTDTGHEGIDKIREEASDSVVTFLRVIVSFIILLTVLIYMAVSK